MDILKKNLVHLLWLLPVVFLLETTICRIDEPDLLFYIALVERFLTTHQWPTLDPYLFTLPNDTLMTAHQWLGYWIFYLPYRALGWAGPILLKCIVITIFLCIPLLPFWKERKVPPLYFALLWTLVIFIASHRFRERISLFGDSFLLILVVGLLWWRNKRWFWYMLPAMFLLWAQIHPSWPLAGAILGAFFCTQHPRTWKPHMFICAGLCFVAPLCNPLWLDGFLYPFVFTRDTAPYLSKWVVEWLPLTDARLFQYHFLYLPFETIVPFIAWRLWQQRKRLELFEVCIFFLAIALNLKSVRFVLLAQGLFLALIVQLELRKPLFTKNIQNNLRIASIVFAVSMSIIIYKEINSEGWKVAPHERFKLDTSLCPVEAVDFIEKIHTNMNIFNSFGFGGYLAWRWQGNPRIFFHGFSTNFKFYEEFIALPQYVPKSFDAMIARYNIGIFLISRMNNNSRYFAILSKRPDFQLVYQDYNAFVFVKKDLSD